MLSFPKYHTFSLEKPLSTNVPYFVLETRIRQVRKGLQTGSLVAILLSTVSISSQAGDGTLGTKGELLSVILVKSEGLRRGRKNAIYLHETS